VRKAYIQHQILIIKVILERNLLNMGASLVYLEKPNKDIEFDVGENSQIKFVAGGMQGWRINMVSISHLFRANLWPENS
jgi:ribonuclease BN (tRNA processing enzyme)